MKIGCFELKTKNRLLLFIDELVRRYNDNRIAYTSGSMAYFFTLSFFPFIMFLSSLIGLLNIDSNALINLISPFFPKQIVSIVAGYNDYVANVSSSFVLIISIIISLYSSSRAIGSLIISINSIYGIEERRHFVHEFLISTTFTVAIGIVIFIFALSIIAGGKVFENLYNSLHLPSISLTLINIAIILVAFIIVFFIMLFLYYFAPNQKMKIKNLVCGSIFSTFGISVMGIGISWYVRLSSRFSLLYGSIGAIIIVMLWFYIFGNIVSIGAEINRILQYRKCMSKDD